MGHSTATITLTVDTVQRQLAKPADRSIFTFSGRRPSNVTNVINWAVREWCDSEDGRDGEPNAGFGVIAPVMPDSAVYEYLDQNHGQVAQESVVIPIARAADVKRTIRRHKVPVTATELAGVRSLLAAGRAEALPQSVWTKVRQLSGATLVSVKVVKTPSPRKPLAKATVGTITTVYEINGTTKDSRPGVIALGTTLADARAQALQIMADDAKQTELTVTARTVRIVEGQGANPILLTVARPAAENAAIEAEVTTETVTANAKPASYLVAFDYHH